MQTIAVTGGAGFIGQHVCRELRRHGYRVRVLDVLVEQTHGAGPVEPHEEMDAFIHGDVRDPEALHRLLGGADGLVHLAAEVGVGQSMYEIGRYVSANTLGTAQLMEAAVKSDIRRIVVASSMSVYGEGRYADADGRIHDDIVRSSAARAGGWDPQGPHGEHLHPVPTPESKPPNLASVYALTKFDQEQLTLILANAYGLEAVALRLFNVFGSGQALSNPYTGVLAIFAGRLLNDQPPLVYEDGRQRRNFVDVRDVATAFRLALETPGIAGETFNIASETDHRVEDVARILARAMDREAISPVILDKARIGDIRHCLADITKARRLLGYAPRHTLEDSVDELVDWVARQTGARDLAVHAQQELEKRGLVV